MSHKIYCSVTIGIFLLISHTYDVFAQDKPPVIQIKTDSLNLFDTVRKRAIPIALYFPVHRSKTQRLKLIILSHGYYQNMPNGNKKLSYLSDFLASNGYFVASIQHELPSDELIPNDGVPQIVRMPFWDRGADNIFFVLSELKKRNPELDYQNVTLIGHSNGGDMTALFPQKYPNRVSRIITMDNRRMALPRTKFPKVYSLRSSDQPADQGVLPTLSEQKKFDIKIVKLTGTIHNDMDNRGTDAQQKEICGYVLRFLQD